MESIFLSDPTDPRLDDIRNLNHSNLRSDLPGGKGLVIGEGPLVISRLLESRFPVRMIVGFGAKLESFLETYGDPGVPVYEVTRETLAKVAGFDMHRGLVAAADRAPSLSVEEVIERANTVVILEGVGNHENVGALFRNAAGLGVDAILFGAGCADPLYRRVVRVSMGHVLRLPFAHLGGTTTTWQRSLELLKGRGFHLVSLTPNTKTTLSEALTPVSNKPVGLLVGAEGPGLTEHAMRATDIRACIPMSEGTDSLNLATAAAIAFYERMKSMAPE
ncbi:TrmH family RNA methyltransferase [Corynebacterium freiburgense]|uniref:TrmH family RNA methyltransferase n=1 Tax=Corynebacterium freiburgense TaxID=556548 RepID=UPI000413EACD|nr:RNA methyltransferase [Corynebacterium freiburgense]WJZ02016.1 Putative TrmH family tRNA/rRNA methyltransferase [Corynebacterium freiburgense]